MTTVTTWTTLSLFLLLSLCNAKPHHQAVYYQPGQQPANYYYQHHGGVPHFASAQQRYAAPVAVPNGASQYLLVYPGVPQHQQDSAFFHDQSAIFRQHHAPQHPVVLQQQHPSVIGHPYGVDGKQGGVAGWFGTIFGAFNGQGSSTTTAEPASTAASEAEETTTASSLTPPEKPEKLVNEASVEPVGPQATDEKTGALENLDETVPETDAAPADGDAKSGTDVGVPYQPDHRFVDVQNPQFYGNYDLVNQGNIHTLAAPGGAVSNFLLRRSHPQPLYPQYLPQYQPHYQPLPFPKHIPTPVDSQYGTPGNAAIAFQKELQAAKLAQKAPLTPAEGLGRAHAYIPGSHHVDISQNVQKFLTRYEGVPQKQIPQAAGGAQELLAIPGVTIPQTLEYQALQNHPGLINVGPGYQNVYYLLPKETAQQVQATAVETQKPAKPDVPSEVQAVEELEQAGPSVAQAKPQAIALAGPGGVAAATPVATSVVGPGGLAIAAPTGTAIAGQMGGGTLTGPAGAALAAANKYLTAGKKNDDSAQGRDDYGY